MKEPDRRHQGRAGRTAQHSDGVSTPGRAASGAGEGSEGPLLATILKACNSEPARAAGWRIEPNPGPGRTRVRNERAAVPEQGWKLHVSEIGRASCRERV